MLSADVEHVLACFFPDFPTPVQGDSFNLDDDNFINDFDINKYNTYKPTTLDEKDLMDVEEDIVGVEDVEEDVEDINPAEYSEFEEIMNKQLEENVKKVEENVKKVEEDSNDTKPEVNTETTNENENKYLVNYDDNETTENVELNPEENAEESKESPEKTQLT